MRTRRLLEDEAGLSLAEILITIVIVGIGFAAILGGMVTSITVSDAHRKQAAADALVRSAAEAVKDQTVTYVNCAGLNAYASALPTDPSGYSTVSVSSVQFWDGTSTDPVAFSGSCPAQDEGVQLVTLVAVADGTTESVEILKRRGT